MAFTQLRDLYYVEVSFIRKSERLVRLVFLSQLIIFSTLVGQIV